MPSGASAATAATQLARRARADRPEAGRGALLYLRQEGRGIGLTNKLKAYALQERGYDTVEANEQLGLPVDGRNYATGSEMLHRLGIRKVRLLTNNPRKAAALKAHGIDVVEIVPVQVPANLQNLKYLRNQEDQARPRPQRRVAGLSERPALPPKTGKTAPRRRSKCP